jgi:hypothetical protein
METPIEMIRLSAAPRASQFSRAKFLGFRCAPPQALCYRPLARAGLELKDPLTNEKSVAH